MHFFPKNEATNFSVDVANDNNFKSFKYKAKLLRNTEADNANGILKNAKITASLKNSSNFWRSFEIPLSKCKVELRPKWTKYCVMSAARVDNVNGNDSDNNITFTIKDTNLYVPVVTLSTRDNQNLLAKDLKYQFIEMNIKQKLRIKMRQMNLDFFSNQILLELKDFLF